MPAFTNINRTHIRYGEVDLVNCLTDTFSQEPVYDESGTDLLYYKYSIAVTCYVHGSTGQGGPTGTGAGEITGAWGGVANQPPTVANEGPAIIPTDDGSGSYEDGVGYTQTGETEFGTSSNEDLGPFFSGGGGTIAQNAVFNYRALRAQLGQPRQPFQMWVGRNQLLASAPAQPSSQTNNAGSAYGGILNEHSNIGIYDLNNGPKILGLEITKVQGPSIFRVQWRVEVCVRHCFGGANDAENLDERGGSLVPHAGHARGNQILSNRWSVSDSIDQDLLTTRTITGTLRASTANVNPNVFREYVVPPLSLGMRISSMQFEVSADGLTLNYTIIHSEIEHAAPWPATSWDFQWSLTTGDGMLATADGRIRLKGDRNVSKGHLIQLGLTILESRLRWNKRGQANPDPNDFSHFIERLTITDKYGNSGSDVSITATVRLVGDEDGAMQDNNGVVRPIPLPQKKAFELLGVPINHQDLGVFGPQYKRNHSRGTRPGAGQVTDWHTDAHAVGAMGHPIEGVLPLQQAFSAAVRNACINQEGRQIPGGEGPWWYNNHSGDYAVPATKFKGYIGVADKKLVPLYPTYSVNTVPAGPGSGGDKGYTDDHKLKPYRYFEATARYHKVTNIVGAVGAGIMGGGAWLAGVAAGNPVAAVQGVWAGAQRAVQLASPQCLWVVRVKAQRMEAHPKLPKMSRTFKDNSNPPIVYTLVNTSHVHQTPEIHGGGALSTFANVEYTYSLSRCPEKATDKIRKTEIPWLKMVNNEELNDPVTGKRVKTEMQNIFYGEQ